MKRLSPLLLSLFMASFLLAGLFGIAHAQTTSVNWDFNDDSIGPWAGTGYSVQSQTLKFVGSDGTTALSNPELFPAFSAISITNSSGVSFSFIYTSTQVFSYTIKFVHPTSFGIYEGTGGPGNGTISRSSSSSNPLTAISLQLEGITTRTVYLDNLTVNIPSAYIDPIPPVPTKPPDLFPTPNSTPYFAIPTALPIPTASITVSLIPTYFWHIPNWEFSISVARTVWALPYVTEVFQLLGYLMLIVIGLSLIRALIGGKAEAQAQAIAAIPETERRDLDERELQRRIDDNRQLIERQAQADRFRQEIERSFLGGRRRRR